MYKILILALMMFCFVFGYGQSDFLYIKQNATYERKFYNQMENKHTSIYPFIVSTEYDSLYKQEKMLSEDRLLQKNDTSNKKKSAIKFKLNPIVSALYYQSTGSQIDLFTFSKGITANTNYKNRLSLNFSAIHINEVHPDYVSERTDSFQIIPHYGRNYTKKGDVYSFADFRGSLSYSASRYINFQAGRERNFLGDGYRSLFLSDNANPLSFVKTTVEIWRIKYLIMYNIHKDINTSSGNIDLNEKYSVIHYLSWNIGKRISLNLFETVIWRGADSTGYRGYDVNYLNPIIFFRPVDFSIGSPDNVIMGIGGKIKALKHTFLYGQIVLDEFKLSEVKAGTGWWANKFGMQAGFKSFDVFKVNGLYFQSELNAVKPFTYSHTTSLENYGNYYQSMAHPLGANFIEGLMLVQYNYNRVGLSFKAIKAKYGTDENGVNYGQNIYRSYDDGRNEYGNKILQGQLNDVFISECKFSYLINPKWNINFELGYRFKRHKVESITKDYNYIFFGFRTNLFNSDVDY